MKKWAAAIAVIAACAAVWFFERQNGATGNPESGGPQTSAASQTPAQPNLPSATAAPAPVGVQPGPPTLPGPTAVPSGGSPSPITIVSHPPQFTNLAPVQALEVMSTAIHTYCSMFHGNPVGTNPEITRALNGGNPKQANFIQPENGMRINGNGELVDPWGNPYFFHQLSGTEMEIRSAGPDGVMWTPDDLITR
jgi:hypothetical protein